MRTRKALGLVTAAFWASLLTAGVRVEARPPGDADIGEHLVRASEWMAKGEYDKAIEEYTKAIELNPKDAALYFCRGTAWSLKGEAGKAIDDFDEAIRLDPDLASAYFNRAGEWLGKGDYDKAIEDYTRAIRLEDPAKATSYHARSQAWSAKGELDRAIADLSEAIRLDPDLLIAVLDRAEVWFDKEDYDKAIADYTEAIRLDPKSAEVLNNRAWLLATCPDAKYRKGKQAVEDATRACELTEWKEAYKLGTLAAAYAEVGDFEKAVAAQEKAQGLYEDEQDRQKGRERLELYKMKKPYREDPVAE